MADQEKPECPNCTRLSADNAGLREALAKIADGEWGRDVCEFASRALTALQSRG